MNQLIGTKPSRFLLAITILAITLLFTFAALPATAKSAKSVVIITQVDDPRILIGAVRPASGTIDIEYMHTKKSHLYTVDDSTTITVNDAPGKIGQIKVGMQVRDYVERDPHTLDSITVSIADPAPTGNAKLK